MSSLKPNITLEVISAVRKHPWRDRGSGSLPGVGLLRHEVGLDLLPDRQEGPALLRVGVLLPLLLYVDDAVGMANFTAQAYGVIDYHDD